MPSPFHSYLKRMPPEFYRGPASVHWSLTIEGRKTGWLDDSFHWSFREIVIHAAFRFGFACPVYCCMSDHLHLLWAGWKTSCDQRQAMRYVRRHLNRVLGAAGYALQQQAYDHVLRDAETQRESFGQLAEYIARNPERKHLVPADGYASYPYMGCVIPGYPELVLFQANFWDSYWRIDSHLRRGFSACDDESVPVAGSGPQQDSRRS